MTRCSPEEWASTMLDSVRELRFVCFFFFSSRRRHTRSVSAFLLNRSSDVRIDTLPIVCFHASKSWRLFYGSSYYPSECHADYFDFERIEALKPAIEACGISTLSQSPMLGFHKQMDNRIKLLEEILSFRMQGVEFDNGDMYVDGHKAASDVRDEFVSVTEKLMDELAQCYNVLPQLDINNTIDHRPEGDEKWFLEN